MPRLPPQHRTRHPGSQSQAQSHRRLLSRYLHVQLYHSRRQMATTQTNCALRLVLSYGVCFATHTHFFYACSFVKVLESHRDHL